VVKKHQEKSKLGFKKQTSIQDSFMKASDSADRERDFNYNLTKWFMEVDIPLAKIDLPATKNFFKKEMDVIVQNRSTLRKKYVPQVYQDTLELIRSKVGENSIYLVIDETTDKQQRYVFNALVGILNGEKSKPMLVAVRYLDVTNNVTVSQTVNDVCLLIWNGNIYYDRLKLIISDQATYMLKAVSNLKNTYPNLKHVTCLAHCLHRVSEVIRLENKDINELISEIKSVLSKAPIRKQHFRKSTGLSPLPKVVTTRWGTWFNAVYYYIENFDKVHEFIISLKDKSESIKNAKKLFKNSGLKKKLIELNEYRFLTKALIDIQTDGLKLTEQFNILNEVADRLSGTALDKFNKSLSKNPDLKEIQNIDTPFQSLLELKYAPLVSVSVERSFSMYKSLLRDNRMSFTEENIEKMLIVNFNKFLYE